MALFDVFQTKKQKINKLNLAIMHDDKKLVKSLIKSGVDINTADKSGNTPLFYASKNKIEIVKLLLDAGADVNITNNAGDTPLYFSRGDAVRKMLEKAGAEDERITGYRTFDKLRSALETMIHHRDKLGDVLHQCAKSLDNIDRELCSNNVDTKNVQKYANELLSLLLSTVSVEWLRADFHRNAIGTISNIVALAIRHNIAWDTEGVESTLVKKLKIINKEAQESSVMAINHSIIAWGIPMILEDLPNPSQETISEIMKLLNYPYEDNEDVRVSAKKALKKINVYPY